MCRFFWTSTATSAPQPCEATGELSPALFACLFLFLVVHVLCIYVWFDYFFSLCLWVVFVVVFAVCFCFLVRRLLLSLSLSVSMCLFVCVSSEPKRVFLLVIGGSCDLVIVVLAVVLAFFFVDCA